MCIGSSYWNPEDDCSGSFRDVKYWDGLVECDAKLVSHWTFRDGDFLDSGKNAMLDDIQKIVLSF